MRLHKQLSSFCGEERSDPLEFIKEKSAWPSHGINVSGEL